MESPLSLPDLSEGKKIHCIEDCAASTDAEKTAMKSALPAQRAKNGPFKRTRNQTANISGSSTGDFRQTTGRLTDSKKSCSTGDPSLFVSISDRLATVDATRFYDDGSDEILVSLMLAERAVLQGVWKLSKINPVKPHVALRKGSKPQTFYFLRTWTAPRKVLRLSSGRMA